MNNHFTSRPIAHDSVTAELAGLLEGVVVGPFSALDLGGRHQTIMVTSEIRPDGVFDLRITCAAMKGIDIDYSSMAVAVMAEATGGAAVQRISRRGYATFVGLPMSEYALRGGAVAQMMAKFDVESQPWRRGEILPDNTLVVDKAHGVNIPVTERDITFDSGDNRGPGIQTIENRGPVDLGRGENRNELADPASTKEVESGPRSAKPEGGEG